MEPNKKDWLKAIEKQLLRYINNSSKCPFCLLDKTFNCIKCIMGNNRFSCTMMLTFRDKEKRKLFWEEAYELLKDLPEERFQGIIEGKRFPELFKLDKKLYYKDFKDTLH